MKYIRVDETSGKAKMDTTTYNKASGQYRPNKINVMVGIYTHKKEAR